MSDDLYDLAKRMRTIASLMRPMKQFTLSDAESVDQAADAIERLQARPAGVEVKPLVWTHEPAGVYTNEAWEADLGYGLARIEYERDEDPEIAFVAILSEDAEPFASLDEAQAFFAEDRRRIILSALAPADPAPAGDTICAACGRDNPVWSAPDEVWNSATGGPDGVLCPTCFMHRAGNRIWRVVPADPAPVSVGAAAKVLLDVLLNAEEHDAWEAAQDAYDDSLKPGKMGESAEVVLAALRALSGEPKP